MNISKWTAILTLLWAFSASARPIDVEFNKCLKLKLRMPTETAVPTRICLNSVRLDFDSKVKTSVVNGMITHLGKESKIASTDPEVWEIREAEDSSIVAGYGVQLYVDARERTVIWLIFSADSQNKIDLAHWVAVGMHHLGPWGRAQDNWFEFDYEPIKDVSI
jgi:hypothetical protein